MHCHSVKKKSAVILLMKNWPQRSGGGLGVAYNYLQGAAEISHSNDFDSISIVGDRIFVLSDPDSRTTLLKGGPSLPKFGATAIFDQIMKCRSICQEYEKSVIFSFTPFYGWKILRMLCPQSSLVHSEHAKGGRHSELAIEQGRTTLKTKLVRHCVFRNFKDADFAVFPSAGAQKLFEDTNPSVRNLVEKKSVIVHNGVEIFSAGENKPPSQALRIISIAHHVPEKGLFEVLSALTLHRKSGHDFSFVNFGSEGMQSDSLKAQSRQIGLGQTETWRGLRPAGEVRESLKGSDVFLHMPEVVVFDLSVLEAMVAGIPIITTPLPGNREALGEDYPLFAEMPDQAATHLRWIDEHPEEARRLGQKLRSRAENLFSNRAMALRYNELFKRCLTL